MHLLWLCFAALKCLKLKGHWIRQIMYSLYCVYISLSQHFFYQYADKHFCYYHYYSFFTVQFHLHSHAHFHRVKSAFAIVQIKKPFNKICFICWLLDSSCSGSKTVIESDLDVVANRARSEVKNFVYFMLLGNSVSISEACNPSVILDGVFLNPLRNEDFVWFRLWQVRAYAPQTQPFVWRLLKDVAV